MSASGYRADKVTIYLIMPNQEVVHEVFDAGQLIFSIFPSIYNRIDHTKEVKITAGSTGKEMDIESMTNTTFRAGGFAPTGTFYIEEVD